MIKIGNTVWVNESTGSGKPLPREWYGKVMEIDCNTAQIKDTNPDSDYYGQVFSRALDALEKKED